MGKATNGKIETDKVKRRTVIPPGTHVACINCRQGHRKCNAASPCSDCIRLGIEDKCVYLPPGRKGRKPKVRPATVQVTSPLSAQKPPTAHSQSAIAKTKASKMLATEQPPARINMSKQAPTVSMSLLSPPMETDSRKSRFAFPESTLDVFSALAQEVADFEASWTAPMFVAAAQTPLSPGESLDYDAAIGAGVLQYQAPPAMGHAHPYLETNKFAQSNLNSLQFGGRLVEGAHIQQQHATVTIPGTDLRIPCITSAPTPLTLQMHQRSSLDGALGGSLVTPPASRRTSESDADQAQQQQIRRISTSNLLRVGADNHSSLRGVIALSDEMAQLLATQASECYVLHGNQHSQYAHGPFAYNGGDVSCAAALPSFYQSSNGGQTMPTMQSYEATMYGDSSSCLVPGLLNKDVYMAR
eukprot:Opistho-2@37333